MDYEKINKLLDHREERVKHQIQLMQEKGTLSSALVTVRINYPGIEKSNYITDKIIEAIGREIKDYFIQTIVYEESYKNSEGSLYHFIIDKSPGLVKKDMIYIEDNHPLGRCVDLDVYGFNEEGVLSGLSRRQEGQPPRKCFLCFKEASICSRSKAHSIDDIKEYFQVKYKSYIKEEALREKLSYDLSQIALKAMVKEVSTMPSYGLVSPTTKGAHKDMDYYTFIDSAFVIIPYIKEMISLGYSCESPERIFSAIRPLGKTAEKAMLDATKGVNTHKGMIFLIGIIGAAAGKALYDGKSFQSISDIIKIMCSDILQDYDLAKAKVVKTHGEELYFKYGITGIRGEVKEGLSFIFKEILPLFDSSELKGNELYSHTLLQLMAAIEDSTIAYRKEPQELFKVKKRAQEILLLGGFKTEKGRKAAECFEEECIKNNISPGGAADLLAAVIFLSEIENKFK